MASVTVTIGVTPRRWWRRWGLAGLVAAWVLLKCGAALRSLFSVKVT